MFRHGLFTILAAITPFLIAPAVRAQTPYSVDVQSLVRSADFVGFVLAQSVSIDLVTNEQSVGIDRMDPVKGSLPRTTPGPPYPAQYPWVSASPTRQPSRPTHFAAKAYYLVFLSKPTPATDRHWSTLACYRIDYRPEASGKIVARLAGVSQLAPNAEMETVRRLLVSVVSGGSGVRDAAAKLNAVLASAALAAQHEPKTHEEQMAIAKPLAASIRVGTLRSDVEKVFLQQDGGLSGPRETRYYMGHEVMVGVPYDRTGGDWKPTNRVTGPLRVYRRGMAFD